MNKKVIAVTSIIGAIIAICTFLWGSGVLKKNVEEKETAYFNVEDSITDHDKVPQNTANNSLDSLTSDTQDAIVTTAEKAVQTVFLFDSPPYMVDGIDLYMLNNDHRTIVNNGGNYVYDSDWKMQSAGDTYLKGMTVTVDSYDQARIYYNLHGQYSKLVGYLAFEDKNSERIDNTYTINFYADDVAVGSYTIYKGDLPKEISIEIDYCAKFVIELVRPSEDNSYHPNINLIGFELSGG